MTDDKARQEIVRVSTIELFFDLVFVFTITQLTHLVEHAHDGVDFLRALLALTVIWWMYAAYAWLTNDAGGGRAMRLVLIAAMAGFVVIALATPGLFGATGLVFALAYLYVVLIHLSAFASQGGPQARAAIFALAPFNLGAAALIIVAGLVDADWDWLFLLAAALIFVAATVLRREQAFSLRAEHFVERHGLVILIVLGESIVAIGSGAADLPLDGRTIAAVVLSLILVAILWWSYFDRDDQRAEHAMIEASPIARTRIAMLGYWYAHLAMIAGIVLIATGIKAVVAHGEGPIGGTTWLLGGGLALYLLGDVAFRYLIGIRTWAPRVIAGVVALGLGAAGGRFGGIAEMLALAVVMVAMLAVERALARGDGG